MNMKVLATLSGCLFLVISAGCVAIPIPLPKTVVAGKEITSERTAFIMPGRTRREDVIQQLGQPYAELPDLQIMAYTWEVHAGEVIWAFYGGAGASTPVYKYYRLLIAFDAADRVVTFEKMESKWPWESVRDLALKWAETQDLVLPKAASIFVAQEIAPGQSALYLYLEGGLWNNLGLSLIKPEVRVNGEAVGWLRRGEFLAIALAPGAHTVTVDSLPLKSMTRLWPTVASIDVQTFPGQAHYVAVRLPDRAAPVLTVRSEAEALPALKEMKPVP